MASSPSRPIKPSSVTVPKPALQKVFDNLQAAGFTLIGPRLREGAIVLEEITRLEDLPRGWCDEQQPGRYGLKKADDSHYFGYGVGPHSWKQFLHPPRLKLFSIEKSDGTWALRPPAESLPRYAFIGVRACDLQAIGIQDRVFLNGPFCDPHYARRREQVFILAANCGRVASTCFCASLKTGPRATGGFDLALTELDDVFVVETGSETGVAMLRDTGGQPATATELSWAQQVSWGVARQIQREMRTDDLPKLLYDNLEHPQWDDVAARCLACANCTMVCPTCFCTTVEDTSNLRGTVAERTRVWDSCFTLDFSHVHGGNSRPNIRARYRQWLTHKLASWIDQFGILGCVGCGRCITWCPVGIDLTAELKAIREKAAR